MIFCVVLLGITLRKRCLKVSCAWAKYLSCRAICKHNYINSRHSKIKNFRTNSTWGPKEGRCRSVKFSVRDKAPCPLTCVGIWVLCGWPHPAGSKCLDCGGWDRGGPDTLGSPPWAPCLCGTVNFLPWGLKSSWTSSWIHSMIPYLIGLWTYFSKTSRSLWLITF